MTSNSLGQPELGTRTEIARRLRVVRPSIATEVTDDFFERHPDWLMRYGEAGRKRGIQDAGFHIDFLSSAIESGSVEAFENYARWCARMLSARQIAPHFLIENLRQIGSRVAAHFGSEQRALVDLYVSHGVSACSEPMIASGEGTHSSALAPSRSLFLQAILNGRRREALAVALEALRTDIPVTTIYIELFQEALHEMGRLWESGSITIAREHMATATAQYVIAQVYSHIPMSAPSRGRAVVTGVEGEFHQIGATLVADTLEASGWDVRFLGSNMPSRGIVQAIEEHQAQFVGISATMLFNIPAVRDLVGAIRERFAEGAPRLAVGGGAFRDSAALCAELRLGRPGSDVISALELASS